MGTPARLATASSVSPSFAGADNRGLNYDKYFKEGDETRNTLTEFNSNNTRRLNLQETIDTIASLQYIQERLAEER